MAGVSKHYILNTLEEYLVDHGATSFLGTMLLRYRANHNISPELETTIQKTLKVGTFRQRLLNSWHLLKVLNIRGKNWVLTEYLVRPGVKRNRCSFRKMASDVRRFKPKVVKIKLQPFRRMGVVAELPQDAARAVAPAQRWNFINPDAPVGAGNNAAQAVPAPPPRLQANGLDWLEPGLHFNRRD